MSTNAPKMNKSNYIELLRGVPVLSELDDTKLELLLTNAGEVSVAPGEFIVRSGSLLADVYIILSGGVEVRNEGSVIATLGKGSFFGEMAFLNDLPSGRSSDIVATKETVCLKIGGPTWYAFLRRNPDVAIEVIRVLTERLRETTWSLHKLQKLPSERRET